jgi:ATP-dependent DNA helicase RecG
MVRQQPFDPVDILARLDWTEYGELEFKSARGGVPKSLWETYSAMANTEGGLILLGVEDDGEVSGVSKPDKLRQQFWDLANNRGKISANLLADSDVSEQQIDGKTILMIDRNPPG